MRACIHTIGNHALTFSNNNNNKSKNKSGILHTTGIPGDCRPFQCCSHVSDCSAPVQLGQNLCIILCE